VTAWTRPVAEWRSNRSSRLRADRIHIAFTELVDSIPLKTNDYCRRSMTGTVNRSPSRLSQQGGEHGIEKNGLVPNSRDRSTGTGLALRLL